MAYGSKNDDIQTFFHTTNWAEKNLSNCKESQSEEGGSLDTVVWVHTHSTNFDHACLPENIVCFMIPILYKYLHMKTQ